MDKIRVGVKTKAEEPMFPDLHGLRCRHLVITGAEQWTLNDVLDLVTRTDWDRFRLLERITINNVSSSELLRKRCRLSYRSRLWNSRAKGEGAGLTNLRRIDVKFGRSTQRDKALKSTEVWLASKRTEDGWTKGLEEDWRRVVRYAGGSR